MGDSAGSLTLETGAAETSDVPPAHPPATRSSRWEFWRSPPDQPRWARPSLLIVAALAALSYGWGIGDATVESFYGAAARSMSQSWHNFFFAAFDPWGTVSVDKLPGAFWIQALSVRVFGYHTWAVVLPQVVEGVLTVLVLYRTVRRVAGPGAGLAAAVALAATPVTILLNRGNISDSLLILLLVLAADATTAGIHDGPTALPCRRGRLGRPRVPGQDAAGLVGPPGALPRLRPGRPGRRPGTPARSCRGLRPRRGRRLAELDVRRHARSGARPSLRRRKLQQLRVQPGVPLQRRRQTYRQHPGSARVQPGTGPGASVAHGPCGHRGRAARAGPVPQRRLRTRRRLAAHTRHGGPGQHPGDTPARAPYRPAARRCRPVGRLVVPDLELLCLVALHQFVLSRRAGATDRRAVRLGAGTSLAAARPSQRARRRRRHGRRRAPRTSSTCCRPTLGYVRGSSSPPCCLP